MHLTTPSHWSRSIGTSGRDPSESAVTIAGMRSRGPLRSLAVYPRAAHRPGWASGRHRWTCRWPSTYDQAGIARTSRSGQGSWRKWKCSRY